ncbi:MAG: CPBP family intramembrane metalloprotease [Myxococcota bacterium]|nr:CPBP family intramembrane metalloprotease [Myxococcota bacterium]
MNQLAPSQRRLQRAPDWTGDRLDRFSQVALRHGLPGALLGALCLLHPESGTLLREALTGLFADPARYLLTGTLVLVLLLAHVWRLDRRLDAGAVGWVLYLLAVSVWEEWLFRLAIPHLGEARGFGLREVALASNILFGLLHYFTLRWKWPWCLGAALGGMALSRQMTEHFDLAWVVALHWIATCLNTPRLPGRPSRRARSTA